jgi:hypothetical protein
MFFHCDSYIPFGKAVSVGSRFLLATLRGDHAAHLPVLWLNPIYIDTTLEENNHERVLES